MVLRSPSSRRATQVAVLAALAAGCSHAPTAPTKAMATALVGRMDQAFNEVSWDDFRALFAPLPPRPWSALERVHRLLSDGHELNQTSVVEDFRPFGDIGVALVCTTSAPLAAGSAGLAPVSRHAYVVFRDRGEGPRALALLDVDRKATAMVEHIYTGAFSCPACNFRVGSDALDKWLVVPSPRQSTGCIETITFYRLGTDLSVAVSVTPNREHLPAADLLAELLTEEAPGEKFEIERWTPAANAGPLPEGLRGARCTVHTDSDDARLFLVTRVTTRGGVSPYEELSYVISAQARPDTLSAYAAELDVLVASFRLVDPSRPPDDVGRTSAHAHTGASLDGLDFHYDRLGFRCTGPETWDARAIGDRCAFGVVYVCPYGEGTIRVAGNEVGPGDADDHQRRILEQLSRCVANHDLEFVRPPHWQPCTGADAPAGMQGVLARLDAVAARPEQEARFPHRQTRVLLFPDVWLVVEATITNEPTQAAFEAVASSLRRTR